MTTPRRPPGRPPGPTRTREKILRAAQEAFLADGYQATTIRKVAAAAGVDQSLVLHYFGSKDGLFAAALRAGAPIAQFTELIGDAASRGGLAELGVPLVEAYLRMWEQPEVSGWIRTIMGAASVSPSAGEMVATFIGEAVMEPLARAIGTPDGEVRANLVGTHLFGTAAARYLLKVRPLASLDRPAVVGLIGPVIQHYLTGHLTAPHPSPP